MSESSEYSSDAATTVLTADDPVVERTTVVADAKPNRLYQAAAWVAIVAGTLFIVSTIFFAGFMLGKQSGGPGRFHHGGFGPGMMMDRPGSGMGSMHHRSGWPGGPGDQRGPGGPGDQRGPGGPGTDNPGQPPQAPTR